MSKTCPKCGKTAADDAKFCMDCGYSFNDGNSKSSSSIFSNGKIFLALIAIILVFGGLFILTSGNGNNHVATDAGDGVEHVDLTITDVLGYDSNYDNKTSYSVYTEALFLDVPSDMKGYVVKTSYYDKNNNLLGQESEKLSYIYYDSDYSISFGDYTSYKKLDLDHVNVEIIKSGKTIDNFTAKVDRNKIDYLN